VAGSQHTPSVERDDAGMAEVATFLPVPAPAAARVRADDPAWARAALVGVVGLAAALFVWGLDASGWANTYYSAAAQAASASWSSFFFGSLDAGDFITLDKPPAAIWVIGLSVRLFGLSSWSILLPQALAGVASVVLLYLIVRRSFGAGAGLIAALVLALTPIAVVMFRYNNPDALLTLLFVLSAGTLLRAVETGRTRWLVATGVLVGLAFLTKYLQGLMVVPALGATYLLAAPGSLRRRVGRLAVFGVVAAVAGGWWVAIVELIPPDARPFIGGSDGDSVVELILGYDGLGRVFGGSGIASAGSDGGGQGSMFGGESGILRMFNTEWAGQIAWLLPAAAVALVAGVWARRRAGRMDPELAGYVLWGVWLGVHVAVFSLSGGIIHPYYAVVMAPPIGALVGAGATSWWRSRGTRPIVDVVAGGAVAATGGLAWIILERTPGFAPGLGAIALALGVVGGIAILVAGRLPSRPRIALAAAALALVAGLVGPAAYAAESAAGVYGGGDPSAGPAFPGSLGGRADGLTDATRPGDNGQGGFPGGLPGGLHGGGPSGGLPGDGPPGDGLPGDGLPDVPGDALMPGGVGGVGAVDDALVDYLVANHAGETWLVAASSAATAAPIQIETGIPVMAMGGFSGSDPAPSADELAGLVAEGRLRFVLLGGMGAGRAGPGGNSAADLSAWVTANCSVVTIDGSTTGLYDCAAD
jgi:4-amino-4-deoxy-L-arabinose transferase-like glycosyltransferase